VIPNDLNVFLDDLWWVVLLKALFAFVLLLILSYVGRRRGQSERSKVSK